MKSLVEFINESKRGAWIPLPDDEIEIKNVDKSGWKSNMDVSGKVKYVDNEDIKLSNITFKLANNRSKYAFEPHFDKTPNKSINVTIADCGASKKDYSIGLQTDGLMYVAHGILINNDGTLTGEVKCIDKVGDKIMELFAEQIKNLTID